MSEPLNETGISIRSDGTGKGLQLRKKCTLVRVLKSNEI